MALSDESIRLATGSFSLLREGFLTGYLEGEVRLEWIPKPRIICAGETADALKEGFDNRPLQLFIPQLGFTAEAMVVGAKHRHELEILIGEVTNSRLQSTQEFIFYLVNFPSLMGERVRTGNRMHMNRLRIAAGPLVCTIDLIHQAGHLDPKDGRQGYLLTHVAEIQKSGQMIAPAEIQEILDALHWFFAFMRGARTGPVLPSVDYPFAEHWISIAPWSVGEPRRVDSWLPSHSCINVDGLFGGFMAKWGDRVWNEGLRNTIAWYIAANAPSAPNEAKILLCQIALEVLASLQRSKGEKAHERIRTLLQSLNIPSQVPSRLRALETYATRLNLDAPGCLTRIRNQFEHPTLKNLGYVGAVDGITRMQAAQYGVFALLCGKGSHRLGILSQDLGPAQGFAAPAFGRP